MIQRIIGILFQKKANILNNLFYTTVLDKKY